ncbi:hypothetical protein A8C56_09515 [Niabella ginsenosidivorans]|uniref:DUF4145 domain-containing protein n=1 Tax=Niabella ginsenosidivorans TaxID=1176587 RepID=A0A1A9I0L3_9BACT|nr:DUF4145 domain-containing protein [Niabella ginsenosidivorans]ANH81188.1 hypothetical protein A8C56_09515 [Niabella ginsenosidivorans]
MKKVKVTAELILACSHCGNKAGHFLLCEAESTSTGYNTVNPFETIEIECSYYLTRYKTCGGISLFYDTEFDEHPGYITEATLCYPVIRTLTDHIPIQIQQTYNEALKVEKVSFTAFSLLIRKSLELLCKDQKAAGRNLKEQITDLATKNIIPANLAKMADALRTLGNIGAHDVSYQIDIEEVRAMKDFLIAMLEYVYVAPSKIEALKKSIDRKMQVK